MVAREQHSLTAIPDILSIMQINVDGCIFLRYDMMNFRKIYAPESRQCRRGTVILQEHHLRATANNM
jgi:hypothetical protein